MPYSKKNKNAVKEYEAKRLKEDPFYRRRRWLKFKYNLTLEDYDNMLLGQNSLCAICNLPMEEKDICIDHCHKTNKVRGLLHRKCNAAIGLLNEDVNVLANAITYLNQNS
jgi:hypothetical protein